MEIKTVEDCFKARLLRKIAPNKEKSDKSFELARRDLKEAMSSLGLGKDFLYKYVVLNSYMAMFHASRGVLYSDGIQEKSHYAIYVYLKEKYCRIVPNSVLQLFEIHRTERHEAIYGLDYEPDKEDAELALKDAKIFVKEMEKLLEKK